MPKSFTVYIASFVQSHPAYDKVYCSTLRIEADGEDFRSSIREQRWGALSAIGA